MSVGVLVGVSACMVNTPPKEQKRLYKSGFFVKIYPFNSFLYIGKIAAIIYLSC